MTKAQSEKIQKRIRLRRRLARFNIHLTAKMLNGFLLGFLVVIGGAQLILANNLSEKGKEIRRMEAERENLLREKSFLKSRIAELGSLERVRSEAEKALGMKEGKGTSEFLVPPRVAVR